jgi:hypothetical protein
MNRHQFIAPPEPQCRKETRNTEYVVEVPVGEQDTIEPSEACATPQQLTLRSFPAVDKDAIAARLD